MAFNGFPISLTTRAGKGSPLNAAEFDDNLNTIKDAANNLDDRLVNIENGTTAVPNADKVDNFHASQNPTSNQIPVLNSSGQLNLPFYQTPILVNGQDLTFRTFYVNAVNGDDNNDGSSSAPFKTIKKACDAVPVGGYGLIYLKGSTNYNTPTEYLISDDIYLRNKYIDFRTDGTYVLIKPQTEVIESLNSSKKIVLESSFLVFHNDDWNSFITIENPQKNDINLDWQSWRQYTIQIRNGSVYFRSVSNNQTPMIRLYDSGAYLIGSQYADYAAFMSIGISVYSIQAENTNAKLLHIGFGGGVCLFKTSTSGSFIDFSGNPLTLNWENIIDGIVKDVNGTPRNIISNIVL